MKVKNNKQKGNQIKHWHILYFVYLIRKCSDEVTPSEIVLFFQFLCYYK